LCYIYEGRHKFAQPPSPPDYKVFAIYLNRET